MRLYLAVGCGAAIGSLVRFLVGLTFAAAWGLADTSATAFVNIVGSFVVVGFATLTGTEGRFLIGPAGRQFVMAGLCGGFTTFSAMSLETFVMLADRDFLAAGAYLISVIAGSLAAAWGGHVLAGAINR